MEQSKIDRLNELAKLAKTCGLTPEQEEERAVLRTEYINAWKQSLRSQLDNTYIVDENGNKRKLKKKK